MRSHRRAQPQLSCLVTAIADDPGHTSTHAAESCTWRFTEPAAFTQAWYLCHASLASGRVGCRPASAVPATLTKGSSE